MKQLASSGALLMTLVLPAAAGAVPEQQAAFAVVVGVNRGVDADSVPLRYADDDAVRFRTLFRTVGMQTHTLARLDENTNRLHPGVAKELTPPRLAELRQVVDRLAVAVAAARAAGKRTVLYVVYAGHGKADGSTGYIMLEDARLRGPDLLAEIIDPVGAEATHVVVDACHSFHAVLGRGPGGRGRHLSGFSHLGGIADRPDVGLLLSTSSARESHEWAAFQAGVFSHEVRSGLHGAADVDGNGLVSYLEIASFVDRANLSVPNEQFRPEVFARPPSTGGATLLDLRAAMSSRIDVDGPYHGHQYLEDTAGVRWADFHNAGRLQVVRPSGARLYLRRANDDREHVLPEGAAVVLVSQLPLQDAHVVARGAAHDLFRSLFALPFSSEAMQSYQARQHDLAARAPPPPDQQAGGVRRFGKLGLAALGVASSLAGGAVAWSAYSLRHDPASIRSQAAAAEANERISRRNRWGAALLGVGGAALVGGAVLWLTEQTPASDVDLAVTPLGVAAGFRGSF